MGYKFNCSACSSELTVRWLKPGEAAKCQKCGAKVIVPPNAPEIKDNLVPLPRPFVKREGRPADPYNCPDCKYLAKVDAARLEEVLLVEVYGACHRYPPDFEGRYPLVTGADWCGEYARKD